MATKQQRENAELDGTSAAVPTRAAGEALALGTGDQELSLAGRLTRRLRPTRYLAERIQRPLKLRDCPQSRIAEQARTLNDLEARTSGTNCGRSRASGSWPCSSTCGSWTASTRSRRRSRPRP